MAILKKIIIIFSLFFSLSIFSETYHDYASWKSNSEISLKKEKLFGFRVSIKWNLSSDTNSINLGDTIRLFDKDNDFYKSFVVNVIAKDKNGYGVDACWISWLKKKRPNEYLSIYPCK